MTPVWLLIGTCEHQNGLRFTEASGKPAVRSRLTNTRRRSPEPFRAIADPPALVEKLASRLGHLLFPCLSLSLFEAHSGTATILFKERNSRSLKRNLYSLNCV